MARDNETNTLELNIKVNGQNLSSISEKCNIGTLRIPSDPSWPKIPLRRSSNNTDDIIEPPCVITLTGTPRKGRSVVQPVASRYLKSRLSQRYEATTHIPKRLPGCFDPRFRRQISRQKAEKPDEFYSTLKNDEETKPELDTHITQGTKKKLENKSQKTGENTNGYIPSRHDVNNLLSNVAKLTDKTIDYAINEQSILEAKHCPTSNCVYKTSCETIMRIINDTINFLKSILKKFISALHATNERYNVESKFSQEQKQKPINKPLLLMVDEKRIHALPINSLNIEAASSSAQSLQCYSVPVVPVVAYRDVPLQMKDASVPTQMEENVKILSVWQNDGKVKDGEIDGDRTAVCTRSTCSFRNESNVTERCIAKSSDDISISGKKSIFKHCDGPDISGRICDNKNTDSSVLSNRDVANEITLSKDHYGNSDALDNAGDADKPSTNVINDKMLDKNMQSLAFGDNKEYRKNKQEKERHGEMLRINAKRKTAPMNLSRKAKSFFRRNSRLAITDSDCTLILPGCRGIKGKRYEKIYGQSLDVRRNGINSTNSILVKYNASRQGRINFRSLTNLRAGNSFEKPSSIPLETQELLNKSYWEYYWKLRRKITSTANDAKERDECLNEDHLPESQTLRQCSVLSCMINTALRDTTRRASTAAADGKPTSDSRLAVNVMSNVRKSVYEASAGLPSMFVKKIQRKKMKRSARSNRLLGLRAIALLCIAMYVAVIFLPMTYDYFFDEEYDDEDTNYIQLTFQYVASSFAEALDGIIDVLTIFLSSVRFNRKR
ncbi:PREDICTED: uncharacterized protein LOC105449886 isoform X3 [Wasmannia auropunctata]|uniref:uncharacterized protein LOC105449886 isoform X3 n=1 Tax=Wasmannia auropunctata TaxID=64793 RepID=UPI0005EE6A86|nr:PREDICTED: uncharacterized protein LOC105449886 isoform X3 [Wasmannia auropunctata]